MATVHSKHPIKPHAGQQLWGLTGGIGSGKSTVATMLGDLGAVVVDADAVSRALTAAGGQAMPAIIERFGQQVADATGALDRVSMRELVFSDASAKDTLQALLHPLIQQQMLNAINKAFAQPGVTHVVCDIPLLVESDQWRKGLSKVWVVDCDEQTQITRVMARSQLSQQAVRAIMASQATRTQRLHAADVVVYNQGIDFDSLRQQVASSAALLGLS